MFKEILQPFKQEVPLNKKFLHLGAGAMVFLAACGGNSDSQNAAELAQALYKQQKAAGVNFSNGPCLSNDLMPDWVADVAHNPRQPVDDLPQNQCSAFREGRAHHFVELDPNGNVIRTY